MNPWAAWLRDNGPARFQLSTKQEWNAFAHSAPRANLELLTPTEAARLTATEREDYDEARMVWNANLPTVRTTQVATAFSVIDQVMASNRRDADRLRGSVVIDAAPGLGKTTIATRYASDLHRRVHRRYGPLTEEGHQRLPVAFISLSGGVTLKGLNQAILRFYAHPAAQRTTSSQLGTVAVDCVNSCHTQLVVIDDLHFVDFRHRNGMDVSNHLKGLANEMAATFMFVGVQLREKRLFDEGRHGRDAAYAQISRRATRCEVAPFHISSDAGFRAWVDLITALEGHLKLRHGEPGMLTQHVRLLFTPLKAISPRSPISSTETCYLAISTGIETITGDLLQTASIDNAAHTGSL
ncbi:MAG: AAA family ATPase [Actinomycetales bacterium]